MFIFINAPYDVAKTKLAAWQRAKELRFLARVERLVQHGDKIGLERKRMAKVLMVASLGLSGTRDVDGVGS